MDPFQRISHILTPPPFDEAPQDSFPVEEQLAPSPDRRLRRTLEMLIQAQSANAPEALGALNDLKRVASEAGLYATAAQMRLQLSILARSTTPEQPTEPARGYLLAADLLVQHLRGEVETIESSEAPIGPSIFKSHFYELTDCLLHGRNVRRAIEIPVFFVEGLLQNVLMPLVKRDLYLRLAEESMAVTLEQTRQRADEDARKRRRHAYLQRRETEQMSQAEDPLTYLDDKAVAYVGQLQNMIATLREGLSDYPLRPSLPGGEDEPLMDEVGIQTRIDHLQGMFPIVKTSRYALFWATMLEELGTLTAASEPERSKAILYTGAETFEKQGDYESGFLFYKLAMFRYEKAHTLYSRSGDERKANEVVSKQTSLGNAEPSS